ncbi:MAG TPA: urease accessory protein UreH [Blastocatellia bacterium]|nr:urease accessory protein UreH [Blastocatellia bacterium]
MIGPTVLLATENVPAANAGVLYALFLGLVYGLKHSTEADHIVAVSTIVSEHRKLSRAALVGALWGAGHTTSLFVVGAFVLALRAAIPDLMRDWLEFGVSLMIITLGVIALTRGIRKRADFHVHRHSHDGFEHTHVHFHEHDTEHSKPTSTHSHAIKQIGFKPIIVGSVHGLAGSGILTVAVMTQIPSVALGLLYLLIFGAGSIIGMLLMSGLIGLPFVLSAKRVSGISNGLQIAAGVFSVAFGFWYAYHTGIATGLLRSIF